MITSDWADVLRCSSCGSPYEKTADALVCRRCDLEFPIADDIPLLIRDSTVGTTLEQIDFDAMHGHNDQLIHTTGVEWTDLIRRLELRTDRVLEVGAGTGVLTLGLLREESVGQLVATDVSHKFLRILAERAAPLTTPLSLVACDANEPHFRNDAFDIVVGRSILHHLLDYDVTLRQSCAMLKPGGAAIFYEPVLDGKTIVTLLLALVLACDEKAATAVLSPEDRDKIQRQVRHQMKSRIGPQDRRSLAKREDKYIFEIAKMKEVGKTVGFADVEFVSRTAVDPTYWPSVVQTCRNIGVPPEKLQQFKWIGEQFADTYGVMFPDRLVPAMGYFVFRKAEGVPTTSATKETKISAPSGRAVDVVRSRLQRGSSSGRAVLVRLFAGLARAGVSVRGARELQVRDRNTGVLQRALVFVVVHDGKRFLLTPDSKSRWARNLRAAGGGALRVGRHVERIRAKRATEGIRPEVFDRWLGQTRGVYVASETPDTASWLVFSIEPSREEPSSS